jgi:GT2 family glycosyltransferase
MLREVLGALASSDPPSGGFEAVVVSDGSTDGTNAWLETFAPSYPFRFESQANSGPGRARNRAAALSRGERLLFLGDDTVPAPDLLARHVDRALAEPRSETIAVLGYTTWHERIRVTPFLRHINENGLQFGYSIIPDPEDVPFNFFYTSNVSLGRSLFEALGGFDTDFPRAAWEDIEFAYRAKRAGLRMVYEPRARAFHDHPTSVASFLRRQQWSGEAAELFARKHPDLADWLGLGCIGEIESRARRVGKRILLGIGERVPFLFSPRLCDGLMRQAYLVGLARALGRGRSALDASAA